MHRCLSRSTVPASALLSAAPPTATGIVHLGLGNFHRAHQAVYTASAAAGESHPWGILGVASRSATTARVMEKQDLLYSVVTISPDDERVSVPAVHTGALVAAHDPGAVVGAIGDAGTRIVTITVSENGYHYSADTGSLDLDSDAIRHDLAHPAEPRTTIGHIAYGLALRADTHGAPVTVVSCDNLLANGRHTERLVRDFIAALPAARRDRTVEWLDSCASFPNSMVDRIVPASTDEHRAAAERRLGVHDAATVGAEPFSAWVLEDRFLAGRPAWERAGAVFTDDVEPYEMMKLRLLNGTHSLIAYLGALDGRATIPDAVARPFIADAASAVLRGDYLPTVKIPDAVDVDSYTGELFSRWSNTALGHRTSQVGSDGSVKLGQRVPAPALHHLAGGDLPHHLALTVAAYLCCVAPPPGFDPGPHARAMVDPAARQLGELSASTTSISRFVRSVFESGRLFPRELAAHEPFVDRVAALADLIVRHGPAEACADAGRTTRN
jgi:fructuronate reductase